MNIRLFKPSLGEEELQMIKKSFEGNWETKIQSVRRPKY